MIPSKLKQIVLLIIILSLFLAIGMHLFATPARPLNSISTQSDVLQIPVPNNKFGGTYSTHAVLVDLSTRKVLYQRAGNEKAYPASLTKIMTAIAAIDALPNLQKKILLPESVFRNLDGADASMAGFLPNEEVKVIDLLYGTMLPSGADAAGGLAAAVSGSEHGFVNLMNRKAKELGMTNTHFVNDSGLQDPDHYTTARDMALLLEYALKNSTFRELFTAQKHDVAPTNLHPQGLTLQSTLFQKIGMGDFDGGRITGGKTGYTNEAGLCLASLAEINSKEYILVTMGAPGDHSTTQYDIQDAFAIYKGLKNGVF